MTSTKHITLFCILLMTLVSNTTFAAGDVSLTYSTNKKSYFSVSIPDDWKVNVGFEIATSKMPKGTTPKPRLITLIPNDNSRLWFGMWVPDSVANVKQAKEYLKQFRGFFVQNPVTKKTIKSKVNGMNVTTVVGEGERDGEIVDIAIAVFQVTKKNVGIAIYIGPPESTQLHRHELKAMMKSIRPAG
jgi:hypothetical protein